MLTTDLSGDPQQADPSGSLSEWGAAMRTEYRVNMHSEKAPCRVIATAPSICPRACKAIQVPTLFYLIVQDVAAGCQRS